MTKESLTVQIKGLQSQLAVLKAQVAGPATATTGQSFADLYGLLKGRAASSEADIGAAEYRLPGPSEAQGSSAT